MRSWVFRSQGSPPQVLKLEDIPQPTAASLGPRDVLVKVNYAALFQGMATLMTQIPHLTSKPWIAENNFSGVILSTGNRVQHVNTEDEVFGSFGVDVLLKYNGVLAEYIILPADAVVRKPRNISLEGAGGIGACGVTAMQFMEVTNLNRGGRVLIVGASGGTGSLVVQAARATVGDEGHVVGICSGANEELVKDLGANEVVDYKACRVLHEHLAIEYSTCPFDVIIDLVDGNQLYQNSPAYLKPDGVFLFGGNMSIIHGGGSILNIIGWLLSITIAKSRPVILGGVPRKCVFHSANMGRESLQKLATFIEEGNMKPVVDSVYDMEQVQQGYARLATSRARGKIMVHVQN